MARELVELPLGGEDDERDLCIAEHGDLVGLLQQPVPALGESHLAVDLVLDPAQLHRPAPHLRRLDTYPLSRHSRRSNGDVDMWEAEDGGEEEGSGGSRLEWCAGNARES